MLTRPASVFSGKTGGSGYSDQTPTYYLSYETAEETVCSQKFSEQITTELSFVTAGAHTTSSNVQTFNVAWRTSCVRAKNSTRPLENTFTNVFPKFLKRSKSSTTKNIQKNNELVNTKK